MPKKKSQILYQQRARKLKTFEFDKEEYDRFQNACYTNGTTPTTEIRRFAREYAERSTNGVKII